MADVTVNTKRLGSGKIKAGATFLGMAKNVRVQWGLSMVLNAEETNAPVAVLHLGDAPKLFATLVGWDADARSLVFPNVSSNNPQWPGSTLAAGAPLATISSLTFVPDDSSFPTVTLNSAVAVLLGTPVKLMGKETLEIPVVFHGLPDGSDNVGSMA